MTRFCHQSGGLSPLFGLASIVTGDTRKSRLYCHVTSVTSVTSRCTCIWAHAREKNHPEGNIENALVTVVTGDGKGAERMAREVEVYAQICARCGLEFEVPASPVDRTGRLTCIGCGAVFASEWQASRVDAVAEAAGA